MLRFANISLSLGLLGATPLSAEAAATEGPLRLRLTLGGEEEEISIQRGEPIAFRLTLSNPSSEAVEFLQGLDPVHNHTALFLKDDQGVIERIRPDRWETVCTFLQRQSFAAGGALDYQGFLFGTMRTGEKGDQAEYLFPRSGDYQILARFSDPVNKVQAESPWLRVRVGSSIPGWEEFQKAGIVDFVEGRLGLKEIQKLEEIRRLGRIFPENPYRSWLLGKEKKFSEARSVDPRARAIAQGLIERFFAALSRQDFVELRELLPDEFLLNEISGKNRAIGIFREGMERLGGLRYEFSNVEIRGGELLVTVMVELSREGARAMSSRKFIFAISMSQGHAMRIAALDMGG